MLETVKPVTSVTIFYDGGCPFCSDYVRYLRLNESAGRPALVNLRQAPEARKELEAEGFDLDRGMVAEIAGARYGGADALQALALLTTPSGVFNRVTGWLFASPAAARFAYPVLRAGRNSVLTLLGRQPFKSDNEGWEAHFTVFSLVFGLFAFIHFFIYGFRYTAFQIYPSTWLILLFGTALLLWPGSKRAFALLIGAMVVDAWLHAPMQSNHTILKNFVLLAILGAGAWHLLRGSRFSEFFRDFVPVGRVLLLVMYFYGVFHKINEGFIDPTVSCAVALWRVMPWPIHLLDFPLIHYLAIYGTFVVETAIMVMLIASRLRNWGIIFGVGFHGFLALSAFAMYPAFTTLAVALHVLFLSPDQARHIVTGENFHALIKRLRSPFGLFLLLICGGLITLSAIQRDFNMVAAIWLLLAVPVSIAILFPGKPTVQDDGSLAATADPDPLVWSRLGWLNLVGVLFFLNCAMPYFGMKTAQAMNMFANLRLEGGINNHLIMRFAPAPFAYLDDLVALRDSDGASIRHERTGAEIGLVYYHLLDWVDRNPEASVSYIRDGVLYLDQTAETLADDIATTLHPQWFRKWFHFQRVLLPAPPPCF